MVYLKGTPSPTERNKQKNSDEEDNISLPPIDEKGKKNDQNQEDKQDGGYSEHVAIMDAEELHTAIEGTAIKKSISRQQTNIPLQKMKKTTTSPQKIETTTNATTWANTHNRKNMTNRVIMLQC